MLASGHRLSRETRAVGDMLQHGPVPRDAVVIVHSAFRGLSRHGYRGEAFIEALLEAIPAGTLLMPTFTWRIVTSDHKFFHEIETPSITGALTEMFRTSYASGRSLHPTHSTAGVGAMAESLLGEHHVDRTPCSARSPFAKLTELDGYVLLLGVGFESCTLVHCGEEAVDPDFYFRPGGEFYTCTDRHGVAHQVYTRRHQPLDRDFPQFEAPMAQAGTLARGTIDGTTWRLFKARDLDRAVRAALAADPRGTLSTVARAG